MASSPTTMRAVRLSAPGPVDNLRLTTLPLPPERDGWVRIRVEAFGLNRSELKLRLGLSVGASFPRVLGIEAAGTVDAAPAGSGLTPKKFSQTRCGLGRGGPTSFVPPRVRIVATGNLAVGSCLGVGGLPAYGRRERVRGPAARSGAGRQARRLPRQLRRTAHRT